MHKFPYRTNRLRALLESHPDGCHHDHSCWGSMPSCVCTRRGLLLHNEAIMRM